MVARTSLVKVDTSKVQGEGAYILWRRITWGERKQIQQAAKDGTYESLRAIVDYLHDWNWVDGEGNPLPIPSTLDDLDKLYDEEIQFLAEVAAKALTGRLELTEETEKN
jgi:hypothetical protein